MLLAGLMMVLLAYSGGKSTDSSSADDDRGHDQPVTEMQKERVCVLLQYLVKRP